MQHATRRLGEASQGRLPSSRDPNTPLIVPVGAARGALSGLLDGPIVSTLLKLAAPTVVVLVVQTLVSVAKPISWVISGPMRWQASHWYSPC